MTYPEPKPARAIRAVPPPVPDRSTPPTRATPGRRLFHLIVAGLGWLLFAWWWWIVFGRLNPDHVRFTLVFIFVTSFACVTVTAIWTIHNRLIYRRKGPRRQVRVVEPDYSRDRLGRSVAFKGTPEQLQNDPLVQIRIEHEGKVYRPYGTLRNERSGAAGR